MPISSHTNRVFLKYDVNIEQKLVFTLWCASSFCLTAAASEEEEEEEAECSPGPVL